MTKLIRAKYQYNLEMMQWMKNFFDHNCAESEYDPVERRAKGKGTCIVRNGNPAKSRIEGEATGTRPSGCCVQQFCYNKFILPA